jgi:hypothetical protein
LRFEDSVLFFGAKMQVVTKQIAQIFGRAAFSGLLQRARRSIGSFPSSENMHG